MGAEMDRGFQTQTKFVTDYGKKVERHLPVEMQGRLLVTSALFNAAYSGLTPCSLAEMIRRNPGNWLKESK